MKSNEKPFCSWIVFQILLGIWMFISPFVSGFGETNIATNNMIWGAPVVILGVGSFFYEMNTHGGTHWDRWNMKKRRADLSLIPSLEDL